MKNKRIISTPKYNIPCISVRLNSITKPKAERKRIMITTNPLTKSLTNVVLFDL